MATADLYILPGDVQLVPVKELPEQAKSRFEYEENDFIITYTNSRNTSKVIDAPSASLLEEFRSPKSLPEGILTYSMLNKLDAQKTLESAYPFLARLRSEGFLLLYDDDFLQKKNDDLRPGDFFKDYEIVTKLRGVTDTGIYKMKKNNSFYALKLLKTNGTPSPLAANFYNEIEILKKSDGTVNPGLIEYGEYKTDNYLVIEWIEAVPCEEYAGKYANPYDAKNLSAVLDLCCNILKAYSHLHRQGIIHSDIHPGNILVTEPGEVRLIDFGLSATVDAVQPPARGGMGFFYEPEYAAAVINNSVPPPSSFKGEQYALAALLYQLITGKQYLQFSYDTKIIFNQILHDDPVAFSSYDIHINPLTEKVLRKALSKDPGERFNSVDEFYEALLPVKTAIMQEDVAATKLSFSLFCDSLQQKYGYGSRLLEQGLQLAPKRSVNFGAAGIAYMFYRMALIESDPELLSLADIWASRAADYTRDREDSFYSKEMDITSGTVGTTSIYHTASGVHLVQALISMETGDFNNYIQSARNFIYEALQPCGSLDLTLGQSATLLGSAYLLETIFPGEQGIRNELVRAGNQVTASIWNTIDEYAAIGEKNPLNYRGIAHGWAGILYATLKWSHISNQPLPSHFFERVEQLVALGIEEENYIRWEISNTEKISWTGWCHGSSGYTFLWTLLSQYTHDERYLRIAGKTVNHFLHADQSGINGSLCCGKAGECYALLNVFKATQDEYYLDEAKRIAKKMLPHVYSSQMRNHSLYKGNIGAGILLKEIARPQFARMPLFE